LISQLSEVKQRLDDLMAEIKRIANNSREKSKGLFNQLIEG